MTLNNDARLFFEQYYHAGRKLEETPAEKFASQIERMKKLNTRLNELIKKINQKKDDYFEALPFARAPSQSVKDAAIKLHQEYAVMFQQRKDKLDELKALALKPSRSEDDRDKVKQLSMERAELKKKMESSKKALDALYRSRGTDAGHLGEGPPNKAQRLRQECDILSAITDEKIAEAKALKDKNTKLEHDREVSLWAEIHELKKEIRSKKFEAEAISHIEKFEMAKQLSDYFKDLISQRESIRDKVHRIHLSSPQSFQMDLELLIMMDELLEKMRLTKNALESIYRPEGTPGHYEVNETWLLKWLQYYYYEKEKGSKIDYLDEKINDLTKALAALHNRRVGKVRVLIFPSL